MSYEEDPEDVTSEEVEEIEEGEEPEADQEEGGEQMGGGLMSRLPRLSLPELAIEGAGKTLRDGAQTALILLAAIFAGLTLAGVSGFGNWYASYVEAGLVAGALLLAIWAGSEKWEATAYLVVAAVYLAWPIVAYEMGWPGWLPVAWGVVTTLGSLAVNFGEPVGQLMLAASKLKKA